MQIYERHLRSTNYLHFTSMEKIMDMVGSIDPLEGDKHDLRMVIADDHALVRGGLKLLVEMASPRTEVIEANSFEQVTDILSEKGSVDLMLLDLMMPGMQGEAGIRAICHSWPDVPVIIVSVKESIGSIRQALAAGAMGYIPKTSSPDVTVSAIRLVLAGGIYVPPHVLRSDTNHQSNSSNISQEPGQEIGLTRRQEEVLDLIVSGKSNKAIASELGLTTGTVKMHVSGIFKKLEVGSRTEAIAKYSELKKSTELLE